MRERILRAIGALCLLAATPASAATLTEVTGFGSNPGNLQMFEYVPTGLAAGRPLVVYLHGCGTGVTQVDNETGWTMWAEQHQFALVFPQQKTSNNASRCFNWFNSADQTRGSGEALSIKQMVDWAVSHHALDVNRIYVTGVSAGGAMTVVMLAAYPDVFKAGQSRQGGPYKCATSLLQSSGCTNGTVNLTPQQWGDKVRGAFGWSGPWPRLSIWHGSADTVASPNNLTELMEQWTNVHGHNLTPDVSDTVNGYPHKVYKDVSGTAVVETYSITGAIHGEFVDPGTGPTQCGVASTYFLDYNMCASYYALLWFGI
ncbi:MAG: PHB depolymerase family esterase [Sphingomonas sp.]|uniref:extracellular catalytic domain type 1 short-chain-length polyhydroxyalkanoate depolymerase n=1 Tax=Sphingomonas sp. TaxID=28214 RepID=UPI0025EB7AF3|nr:PHB depolymerase family esterase [Sphingomonas sp.]MBQ1499146.1 PHB depolymerase family esterase [Sphingomonas sp.]